MDRLHEHILENIFSFVPLIDLAQAMNVSDEWKLTISSSLLLLNPLKPWLFFHHQNMDLPDTILTKAFDPRSKSWIQINRPAPPPSKYFSIRSSHSDIVYMLNPSSLSFSCDPFHLNWHHTPTPHVWRVDPIVAVVGSKFVIAGGTWEFDDPLASVEIYDVNTGFREFGESIPVTLNESAASTWLSVATNGMVLYVMERESGMTHTFDPESKTWSAEPHHLFPWRDTLISIITFTCGRLIVIGLIGDDMGNASGLKLCYVNPENFEIEEIEEMPKTMFNRMNTESLVQISSINACSAGNWLYIYNSSEIGDVYVCELLVNGRCRWTLETIPIKNEDDGLSSWRTVAVTCSEVGIYDVDKALRSEKWTCVPMEFNDMQ